MNWNHWIEKIKACKKEQILILFLAGILLLVIAVPAGSGDIQTKVTPEKETNLQEQDSTEDTAEKLEQKLQRILTKVEGIGRTEVMITLKSDGKRIVEKDEEKSQSREESQQEGSSSDSSQSGTGENTVYLKDHEGNESPYVMENLEPEIAGVLVVAQGADNPVTVSEITDAVMALFGVEAHKIKVMKME